MDPKESVFRGFLFPQFFYIVLCERIENRTPKNAEERPETIESSQALHRLAIERFFRQSSNARTREEVDSNLGIFLSKIHLSSGPPGEKAVQIALLKNNDERARGRTTTPANRQRRVGVRANGKTAL